MLAEQFKTRMQDLLGGEYPDFIRAIEEDDAVKGLRINLKKCKDGRLSDGIEEHLSPLPYLSNGYILDTDIRIGNTPEHHAGMIYVQDPGAMSTLSALDIEPEWQIADLCAAPGGKSSQAAERLSDEGFILCNEYVPKRAKTVVSNLERLGITNALVTSLDTKELKQMYRGVFDLVIADAPCSGEGMFRKSDEALEEWSLENVLRCASRQGEILDNAASMVKGGGYLLYSTCTYSLEENEGAVYSFLTSHPDFTLIEVKPELAAVTSDGITKGFPEEMGLWKCRRFYPHKQPGEGQFLALMLKGENSEEPHIAYKDAAKPMSREDERLIRNFFSEALTSNPKGRLVKIGENPVLIPHGCPVPPHSVFMAGVLLGEIKGSVFRPSHQFFSCYGNLFKIKIDLKYNDPAVFTYLKGGEITCHSDDKGWCSVMYEGVPLGGGKVSCGTVKNHYPKGLRLH